MYNKHFIIISIVLSLAVIGGVFFGCEKGQPTATAQREIVLSQAGESTCEKYGTITVGDYVIQNNVWGADTRQCIESTGGTGFRVSVSEHDQGSVAAYPSIFKGCHWDVCSSDKGGGPIRLSECSSANFSFEVSGNRPAGDYNVAAEAWLSPESDCSGGYEGGAEIMIVLDYQNMYPAGSQVGTFNGHDVYYTDVGWEFYTYVKTGRNSASGDMMDFINDAMSRSSEIQSSWYLHVMEAGFEIMRGGEGLECNSFSFSMTGGGPTTTTTVGPTTTTTTAVTTTTTTAAGDCDCGTCDWYGRDFPACCNKTTGWGWSDGGCNRTCVGCQTCLDAGQTCNNCTACNGGTTTTTSAVTTTTTTAGPTTTTAGTTTTTSAATGCTCDAGCSSRTSISVPFTREGSGEYCWETTSLGSFINSWNLDKLEINDVDYTNTWSNSFPDKIDGKYYIYYKGAYPWSHFEAK